MPASRLSALLLLGTAFAATPVGRPAAAQTLAAQAAGSALHAGQLPVAVHQSQVVKVDRPYARALIGDDKIADVLPLTNQSLYVLGKRSGTTSLTVYDRNRNLLAIMDIVVGPDLVALRRQFADLLPGEKIDARLSNESIVLTGVVSNAVVAQRAVQLAETYAIGAGGSGDGGSDAPAAATPLGGSNLSLTIAAPAGGGGEAKRSNVINLLSVGASQQVMLEVRFSEMRRGAARQLGFNHAFISDNGRFQGGLGETAARTAVLTNQSGIPTINLPGILNTFGIVAGSVRLGGLNLFGALDALEENGVVTTLAEPTLIALSGETASFLAGGEFPIPVLQTATLGATGTNTSGITIEYKPFGVGLSFTPTVLADGVINLTVRSEVSSLDPGASVSVNGLVIPGLRVRRAQTTLELHDGQSFAMAGLLSRNFNSTVRRLPFLGSLPVIGALFRSSGFQNEDTELVIIATPRLVRPVMPDQLKLPTDRVRPPSESDLFLFGRTDSAVRRDPVALDRPDQPVTRGVPRPVPDAHLLEEPKP